MEFSWYRIDIKKQTQEVEFLHFNTGWNSRSLFGFVNDTAGLYVDLFWINLLYFNKEN